MGQGLSYSPAEMLMEDHAQRPITKQTSGCGEGNVAGGWVGGWGEGCGGGRGGVLPRRLRSSSPSAHPFGKTASAGAGKSTDKLRGAA